MTQTKITQKMYFNALKSFIGENEQITVDGITYTEKMLTEFIDGQIEIRLDAGKSVVFSSEVGKTLTVKSSDDVTVTCNGSELAVGTEALLTDATFSVSNSTDKLVIFTVIIK